MGKQIIGIEGMTARDIDIQIQSGAKFVMYMYCVSIVVMSFKRYSDIYFIMPGEKAAKHSPQFTMISVFLGWWGIPWGPIWTITALSTNLKGGKDVTTQIAAQLKLKAQVKQVEESA